MNYEIAQCKGECGKRRAIVNRKYFLCNECNKDRINERSILTAARNPSKSKQLADEVFYQTAWKIKPNYCEECGLYLSKFSRAFISHILTKGAHDPLRNHLDNFNKLCLEHHNQWEFGDRKSMKIYEGNQLIIEKLLKYERGEVDKKD